MIKKPRVPKRKTGLEWITYLENTLAYQQEQLGIKDAEIAALTEEVDRLSTYLHVAYIFINPKEKRKKKP